MLQKFNSTQSNHSVTEHSELTIHYCTEKTLSVTVIAGSNRVTFFLYH